MGFLDGLEHDLKQMVPAVAPAATHGNELEFHPYSEGIAPG